MKRLRHRWARMATVAFVFACPAAVGADSGKSYDITYLGGGSYEFEPVVAVDHSGNVLVAGTTQSADFPTTPGAYSRTYRGPTGQGDDERGGMVISKFDASLQRLIASTFVCGSAGDAAIAMAQDSAGNVIVVGRSKSTDFPTTKKAHDRSYNGGENDVVVAKLNSDLSKLLAATYIGGQGDDGGYSIAIHEDGDIFVSGYTTSTNFPATAGSFSSSYNGGTRDGFIARLSSDLSRLKAATYIGGNGMDCNDGDCKIQLHDGKVYVGGTTTSTDFPTTSGAYDQSFNGGGGEWWGGDGFFAVVDLDLRKLLAATYYGGSDADWIHGFAVDADGGVYGGLHTNSPDLPTTNGGHRTGPCAVVTMTSDLKAMVSSARFGGSGNDNPWTLTVDSSGAPYLAGFAGSNDFQVKATAFQARKGDSDSDDGYIVSWDSRLKIPQASTFVGGNEADTCRSMAVAPNGDLYVTGTTSSTNLPTVATSYDPAFGGPASEYSFGDFFVLRINPYLMKSVPKVDVQCLEVKATPVSVPTGSDVTATTKLKNRSAYPSRPATMEFHLSVDRTLSTVDVQLGGLDQPIVGSKKTSVTVAKLIVPEDTPAGSYYVIAVYDPDAVNQDPNRTNNVRVSGKKITVTSR